MALTAIVPRRRFNFTKFFVLTSKQPFRRALLLFPIYSFFTVWIVSYFVTQKGVNGWMKVHTYQSGSCPPGATSAPKNYKTDNSTGQTTVTGCTISDGTNAWISAVVAGVVTLICVLCLRLVSRLVERDLKALEKFDADHAARMSAKAAGIEDGMVQADRDAEAAAEAHAAETRSKRGRFGNFIVDAGKMVARPFMFGANVDVHEIIDNEEKARRMHNAARCTPLRGCAKRAILERMTQTQGAPRSRSRLSVDQDNTFQSRGV